jgi:hypothetical protein
MRSVPHLLKVEHCQNDRESWSRVWTIRKGEDGVETSCISDLSHALARRLVEKLLDRHNVPQDRRIGVFGGSIILVRES